MTGQRTREQDDADGIDIFGAPLSGAEGGTSRPSSVPLSGGRPATSSPAGEGPLVSHANDAREHADGVDREGSRGGYQLSLIGDAA